MYHGTCTSIRLLTRHRPTPFPADCPPWDSTFYFFGFLSRRSLPALNHEDLSECWLQGHVPQIRSATSSAKIHLEWLPSIDCPRPCTLVDAPTADVAPCGHWATARPNLACSWWIQWRTHGTAPSTKMYSVLQQPCMCVSMYFVSMYFFIWNQPCMVLV